MQSDIKELQWLESDISRNMKYAIMLGFCKSYNHSYAYIFVITNICTYIVIMHYSLLFSADELPLGPLTSNFK